MNEKTKRILSYVACGLGGVALGIALLGGLSYCSVSEKAEQTEVNTILTKKNAIGTTDQGGYTSYYIDLPTSYPSTGGQANLKVYSVDISTYTLTQTVSLGYTDMTDTYQCQQKVLEIRGNYVPSTSPENQMNFMAFYAKKANGTRFLYMSFLKGATPSLNPLPFVVTNIGWAYQGSLQDGSWVSQAGNGLYILPSEMSEIMCNFASAEPMPSSYHIQDVNSYYRELGYQSGYQDGETVGYNSGYADGFDDGADNGLLFTDLGVNQLTWASADLSWDDSTDTTQTMKLFDFKDGENSSYYVTLTDYSLGGGNASVQVFKNGTASNNIYATIASGTWNGAYTQLEIIPSNYLKFEFAQITTYYHNSIPNGWFTLSGIPANATGYEVGYQTGYREGYLASPGGQATENVFSLFTNAFDSVGGIFNLKIFGFLPLYWFFLTPIFIAIIALLLRLVKH